MPPEFHDEKPEKVFATIDDAVAHIDHAVKVAGSTTWGSAAISTGSAARPTDWKILKTIQLAAALLRKGYSDEDVKKIMGGNTLRVIRAVVGK